MLRWSSLIAILALLVGGCSAIPSLIAQPVSESSALVNVPMAEATNPETACAVTPTVMDQPPKDPNADPFGYGNWQINDDRTIWVDIPPSGVWRTGGEKSIWIRPAGSDLRVSGQRLDAKGEPLRVDAPCCYPTGFQVAGIYFPTAGCWEVTADAGEHQLRFVIRVEAAEDAGKDVDKNAGGPPPPLASSVLLEICDSTDCQLTPIDTETGEIAGPYQPIPLARYATIGISPDLSLLALITYQDSAYLRHGKLAFVDLSTWETYTTTLRFDSVSSAPIFSRGNDHLFVVTQEPMTPAFDTPAFDIVYLVDVSAGTWVAKAQLDFHATSYQFTADGREIMIYGSKAAPGKSSEQAYVALLDSASLESLWEAPVEGLLNGVVMKEGTTDPIDGYWWQPAATFAPDSAKLSIVHADQEQLTTVDFDAHTISTQEIRKPLSWIEQLLMLTAQPAYAKMANGTSKGATFSADGSQLYVIGSSFAMEEGHGVVPQGLGLQRIDPRNGGLLATYETDSQSLAFDSAGGRLFLHGWNQPEGQPDDSQWSEVVDAATLQRVALLQDKAVVVSRRLDGAPVLLYTSYLPNRQTEFGILDPETLEVIHSSSDWYNGYVLWVDMP